MNTDTNPTADVTKEVDNTEVTPQIEGEITTQTILDASSKQAESSDTVEDGLDDNHVDDNPPTVNKAWAEMRTENAKYKSEIDRLDIMAKKSGFADYAAFLEVAEKDQLEKEAESTGVPVEILQKLNRVDALEERLNQQDEAVKNQQFLNNLDETFNSLGVDEKLSNNVIIAMDKDGVSIDTLKSLPKTTLKRFIKSYLPEDFGKQQELEKINNLKHTIPISAANQNSSTLSADDLIKKRAENWNPFKED